LDMFLEFDEREILQGSGKVTAKLAKTHAESEFEKYRIVHDRLFESDFDRVIKQLEEKTVQKWKQDNKKTTGASRKLLDSLNLKG